MELLVCDWVQSAIFGGVLHEFIAVNNPVRPDRMLTWVQAKFHAPSTFTTCWLPSLARHGVFGDCGVRRIEAAVPDFAPPPAFHDIALLVFAFTHSAALPQIGGSHAQREVFLRTLALMAADAGDSAVAAALLARRRVYRTDDRFAAQAHARLALALRAPARRADA